MSWRHRSSGQTGDDVKKISDVIKDKAEHCEQLRRFWFSRSFFFFWLQKTAPVFGNPFTVKQKNSLSGVKKSFGAF